MFDHSRFVLVEARHRARQLANLTECGKPAEAAERYHAL
jgi:hypothetical protein